MRRLAVVSCLWLLAAASTAPAQVVFGLWTTPADGGGNSRLVTFNAATPQTFTVVGNTGLPTASNFTNGLEFDGAGNLFLSGGTNAGFWHSVNTSTGAATPIGGSGVAAAETITDLAWDPVGNRMLGIGASGVAASNPTLYSIDTATGAATNLASLTGIPDQVAVSLAVNTSGSIFVHGVATDRWYSVNPIGFAVTALAVLPFDSNFGQGGTIDRNTNTLYHAAFNATVFQAELYTIDQTTGAATLLGGLGTLTNPQPNQIADIAIAPIPEPTSLALLGLASCTWLARRRTKQKA